MHQLDNLLVDTAGLLSHRVCSNRWLCFGQMEVFAPVQTVPSFPGGKATAARAHTVGTNRLAECTPHF